VSTPGRRKALNALAARKRNNLQRVARGQKPIKGGKRVNASSIKGLPNTKKGAQARLAAQRKRKGK
jgi:hypothetical protein